MDVKIGVIGASGYTGGELLRILANHPNAEVTFVSSREYVHKPLTYIHPNLKGFYTSLKFSELNLDIVTSKCDLVFVNTPIGVSTTITPKLMEQGLKVIDLSPDYRLKKAELYTSWYGFDHPQPDILAKAVYGLPELHRDKIAGASLVACPGCNATASLLSLIPAVEKKIVDLSKIIVDVKVGSSEAGTKHTLGTHHPERANVVRPYEASGHRHVAEIEQELSMLSGKDVRVGLVPHAVGAVRGVLATSHVWLNDDTADEQSIWRVYTHRYSREPFVRIVRAGIHRYPDPKYVIGSNFADVGFAVEKRIRRAALMAALDNLMKGGAGQAVQCFNIMRGLDEKTGIFFPALRPA